VNNGFVVLNYEDDSWHIFHIMHLYAKYINSGNAEFAFICELRDFKRKLLLSAESGNIHATHLLIRLGELQTRKFFYTGDLPASFMQIIMNEFFDINVIHWCEKMLGLQTDEVRLQVGAARRLAACETDMAKKVELMRFAADNGCWRSLIDLGVLMLESGDDEDAVSCLTGALKFDHSSELLQRLFTAFNKIDVLNRLQLLPIYLRICEELIIAREPFRFDKLIALAVTSNDPVLIERWRDMQMMLQVNEMDRIRLHQLIQDTLASLTAAAKKHTKDGRSLTI
jgi:hypothetical protein